MPETARYGEWVSPISAGALAAAGHPVLGGTFVGQEIWWSELRPAEGGRYAVRRAAGSGEPQDVLPAPWNARTRVHEYGGGAWVATDSGGTPADGGVAGGGHTLVFAEFRDQRLYRLAPGGDPEPITPEPPEPAAWRYADLQLVGSEVWCVREQHANGQVSRDIAAVALDGSGIRSVVAGSHFLAYPRVSPDGRQLAWIAWEHPQMPWDGTELRVATLRDSRVDGWTVLAGSTSESVLQPEWAANDTLYASSDRTGYWNLYAFDVNGADARPLCPYEADFGGPLWALGSGWYRILDDGTLLTVRTLGTDTFAILNPRTGELRDLDLGLGDLGRTVLGGVRGRTALAVCGSATAPSGLRLLDLHEQTVTDVRRNEDDLPDAGYLPQAELRTFTGEHGRDVHAVVYPPRNADFAAPDGELPPYVAFVHGGPTSHVGPAISTKVAYFTSRGIGVVDVNYGGSTGYGREYRDRLRGEWGVVDVEDTVAAVVGLADAGLADQGRLAIEGGSAGGWTVLAALTRTGTFACGTSYFGVAELLEFVQETHDFESRYVDGLVGPLPETHDRYVERAPLSHVGELSCPVLLLQGLDDPIVPPAQAERFVAALRGKGIPFGYRTYEGESHGFRRAETIIDATEAELSFYGQVMGFTPPGVPVLQLERP